MFKYGSDKLDLRDPLSISDVAEAFRDSKFNIFQSNIERGTIEPFPLPKQRSDTKNIPEPHHGPLCTRLAPMQLIKSGESNLRPRAVVNVFFKNDLSEK
ncbi:unnamed protein product [Onchocerca flexuosa]|uniref:Uncharacterized protein n=1 Tax=Onchocerca flexuosa TaxID=387005 RepID=A0A183HGD5_9BILA|nr:unnamed protein product [Onchocerca flexuosa]